MSQAELGIGQLDLEDRHLYYPHFLPIKDTGIQIQKGQFETVMGYGKFTEIFYVAFPHLANTGIAEVINEVAEVISHDSVPPEDGGPILITGSFGKMLSSDRVPQGFYTPRRIFGQLAQIYPSIPFFGELASQAIDVDLRFKLRPGLDLFALEDVIREACIRQQFTIPVTTTRKNIGSYRSLDTMFGDRVKLDLGELPGDLDYDSWLTNTRMGWPVTAKDLYCGGTWGHDGVRVTGFARTLLCLEDGSFGIEMADRAQAVVTALRACLNRCFYPPSSNIVLPGLKPLWEFLEDEAHWETFQQHSVGREHMIAAVQPQVTSGLLLNTLCSPRSLRRLNRAHILDQVPLGGILSESLIEKIIDSVRPDYDTLFRNGSLTVEDCGLTVVARELDREIPELLPLMQLTD